MARFLMLMLLALAGQAPATTPQERTIASATSPHLAYRGGTPVTVQYARREGYANLGGENAALIARLKQQVQDCARSNPAAKQVTDWPDHMWFTRHEDYAAANRRIEYVMTATYGVDIRDCTLLPGLVSFATLASAGRICKIDLLKKIATGDCERDGHANAPPGPRMTTSMDQLIKQMERNPAMAGVAAQMRAQQALAAQRTGEKRVVMGAGCDVWRHKVPTIATPTMFCLSNGGSFIPAIAMEVGGMGGLVLEEDNPNGWRLHAVDVKIDTQVGNAVFAPYAGGGYTFEK